ALVHLDRAGAGRVRQHDPRRGGERPAAVVGPVAAAADQGAAVAAPPVGRRVRRPAPHAQPAAAAHPGGVAEEPVGGRVAHRQRQRPRPSPPGAVAWLPVKVFPLRLTVGPNAPFCPSSSAPPALPVAPAVLAVNTESVIVSVRPEPATAPVVYRTAPAPWP